MNYILPQRSHVLTCNIWSGSIWEWEYPKTLLKEKIELKILLKCLFYYDYDYFLLLLTYEIFKKEGKRKLPSKGVTKDISNWKKYLEREKEKKKRERKTGNSIQPKWLYRKELVTGTWWRETNNCTANLQLQNQIVQPSQWPQSPLFCWPIEAW